MTRFKWNNPNEGFTLGVHCQQVLKQEFDEDDDEKRFDVDKAVPATVFIIGFLLFNIEFCW